MELVRSGAVTRAARRFATQPFGAVGVTRPDGSGMPEVQVTNPGGGTLGGDRLELEIDLGAGARATVCTQGAVKAYRGVPAVQRTRLAVRAGGLLEYVPHHTIPFAGSRYRQETVADIAADATLVAWEAFAAGRLARGERFAFDRLSARTLVLRDGTPEAIDGFELAAGGEPFGGYSYLATAHVLAPALTGLAGELHAFLAEVSGASASASAPAPGVVAARILASDAPALYRALNGVRALVRAGLGLAPAPREVV